MNAKTQQSKQMKNGKGNVLSHIVIAAVFFGAGLAASMAVDPAKPKMPPILAHSQAAGNLDHGAIKHATSKMASESLDYLRVHMPNTPLVGASVSKYAPGLIAVQPQKGNNPIFFDPIRKYLIIGLIVDLSPDAKRNQNIAGGQLQ